MKTTRQQKVARQLQKDFSDIFNGATSEITHNRMITVTVVRVSPDLSFARVYISVFPSEDADKILDNLKHHVKHIRQELGKKVRHQLRIVPEIAFFRDDSLDYAERINEILK